MLLVLLLSLCLILQTDALYSKFDTLSHFPRFFGGFARPSIVHRPRFFGSAPALYKERTPFFHPNHVTARPQFYPSLFRQNHGINPLDVFTRQLKHDFFQPKYTSPLHSLLNPPHINNNRNYQRMDKPFFNHHRHFQKPSQYLNAESINQRQNDALREVLQDSKYENIPNVNVDNTKQTLAESEINQGVPERKDKVNSVKPQIKQGLQETKDKVGEVDNSYAAEKVTKTTSLKIKDHHNDDDFIIVGEEEENEWPVEEKGFWASEGYVNNRGKFVKY